jgi:hypothetical protein
MSSQRKENDVRESKVMGESRVEVEGFHFSSEGYRTMAGE